MAIVNVDLVGGFAINPGYEWRLNIYYPGNVPTLALWGQIWQSYTPESGIAKFTFDRPQFEQPLNRTRITAVLNSFTTRGLEPTEGGFYVYEIRSTLPGKQPIALLAGKVHVNQTLQALT